MPPVLDAKLEEDVLHLRVDAARFDAATARAFKEECAALWQPQIQRLVIDLGAVEFLDSVGVGALLSALKRLPKRERNVQLIHTRKPVQSILELMQMHKIFEIKL